MIYRKVNNKKIKLPQKWEEISKKKQKDIEALIEIPMDIHELRVKMFFLLMQGQLINFKRIPEDDIQDICDTFSWILDRFKVNLYFPDEVEKISFKEFMEFERFVTEFLSTGKAENLDIILAIICRPKRADYDPDEHVDIREPFQEASVNERIERIELMPEQEREIFIQHFFSLRTDLIEQFPNIFTALDDVKAEDKKMEEQVGDSWGKILKGLSEDITKREEVAQMSVQEILYEYSEKIEEYEKMKNDE